MWPRKSTKVCKIQKSNPSWVPDDKGPSDVNDWDDDGDDDGDDVGHGDGGDEWGSVLIDAWPPSQHLLSDEIDLTTGWEFEIGNESDFVIG